MPDPKDATRTGVSDAEHQTPKPEGDPKPGKELDATTDEVIEPQPTFADRRNLILENIVTTRNEQFEKELSTSTIPEPKKDEEEDEVLKDDTPEKPGKKKPKDAQQPADEEEELIIEGTKQKVPKSKIYDTGKRALQKELAADKKLEEASKKAKEIVTAAEQEAEKIKQVTVKRPSDEKPSDADNPTAALDKDPEFDKTLSTWVSKIQYGSEDEAKEALREILTQGRGKPTPATPAIKEEEVIEKVEQRLVLKGIRAKFNGEFSDLTEDPELYDIVVKRVNAALTGGKPNTWETYQEVGNAVRERYVRHETTIEENPENTPEKKPANLEQRREKKRSITPSTPAGGRTTITEAPQTNPDVASTIAAMRKSRGQS